jgi:hypothetical protein
MLQFEAHLLMQEMRLRPGEETKNLDAFMQQLHRAFPKYSNALDALRQVIIESKCPHVLFEPIKAYGISMADKCVINDRVLRLSFSYAAYVILHEIAHQMQYTKHGENFAEGIFLHDLPDEQLARMLRKIEMTADRYAIAKLKKILHESNIDAGEVPTSIYKYTPDIDLLSHIKNVRRQVKQHNFKTIEQVNEWIYNSIKPFAKPPP